MRALHCSMHLHKVIRTLEVLYGEKLTKSVSSWKEDGEPFLLPCSVPGIYQAHLYDGLTLVGKSGDFPWTLIHLLDDLSLPVWQVDFFETDSWERACMLEKAYSAALDGQDFDLGPL